MSGQDRATHKTAELTNAEEFANKITPIQMKIYELFEECESVNRGGSAWTAISSATECFARGRAKALGCDGEVLRENVQRFLLLNPDMQFGSFLQEEVKRRQSGKDPEAYWKIDQQR